jgi:hypothetical protein
MATQSYRERMKAQRAAARVKREAEKAERHRHVALMSEVRRLSLEAVKANIRARGDRVTLYTYAQLRTQADAMIGPWLVAMAKENIAERRLMGTSVAHNSCSKGRSNDSQGLCPSID